MQRNAKHQPGSPAGFQTALEGIRVADFSRVVAGPFCTMNLADFGAEVIKVEPPRIGDPQRYAPPVPEGAEGNGGFFLLFNRNKKSLGLDMAHPGARKALERLIERSDVLVENFKPGTMEKFGLGYEQARKINPSIIYASLSGFGQTGPWSKRPAFDLIVQALSGAMSITGYPDDPPTRVGFDVSDFTGGVYLAFGIVLALFHRQRTGQGQLVDFSMLDGLISILGSAVMEYLLMGSIARPEGGRHPHDAPHGVYECSDGYVALGTVTPNIWKKVCEIIKRPDLWEDPSLRDPSGRAAKRDMIDKIVQQWIGGRSCDEIEDILEAAGIPHGKVNNLGEALEMDVLAAREMIVEFDHPKIGRLRVPGQPVKMSETPGRMSSRPPLLGEHTREILIGVLGLSEPEVDELARCGAI